LSTSYEPVDLLLLSGARPHLLCKTLDSFSKNAFGNFYIKNVFANVDRFQGGDKEVSEVVEIIREIWPAAEIRLPPKPSFTGAVKWLWSSVSSPYCFHLEDDWVAQREINSGMVFPHFKDNTEQVSILTFEKQWKFKYPFHCKWERRTIFGVPVGKRLSPEEPVFTTSPSFMTRDFANTCASLMDEDLDPEKQLYDGRNQELRRFTTGFRNRLISSDGGFLIRDIGREYREAVGVKKITIDGKSKWSKPTL
jgi:hypothetical protein